MFPPSVGTERVPSRCVWAEPQGGPWGRPGLGMPDGPVARSGSALLGSERCWGGVLCAPRCVLCSSPPRPPTPLTAAWSLPGALCPHGSAACRTQVLHTERPWALVLHTEQLQKPRRAEGSQVLSSGGGSGWGPWSPLQAHSGSLQGAPLLVLCALPWRAWALPTLRHPGHACHPLPTPWRFLCCC